MKRSLFILFASLVTLFVACSPEIKLQNHLTRDGGRWNIDEFKVTSVTKTDPPTEPTIIQEFNVGEILFYESGTGIWIQYDTLTMQNVATYFEWENTNNSITMDLEGFTEEVEFSINEVSKDEQWWVREESFFVGDLETVVTTEIHIVREEEIGNK